MDQIPHPGGFKEEVRQTSVRDCLGILNPALERRVGLESLLALHFCDSIKLTSGLKGENETPVMSMNNTR